MYTRNYIITVKLYRCILLLQLYEAVQSHKYVYVKRMTQCFPKNLCRNEWYHPKIFFKRNDHHMTYVIIISPNINYHLSISYNTLDIAMEY